jgi:hypothetical protein
MQADDQHAPPESALAAWRRSYSRLRALERQLVEIARADEPGDLAHLHREIEELRIATTGMFTTAQIESVSRHVKLFGAAPSLREQHDFSFLTLPPRASLRSQHDPALRPQHELNPAPPAAPGVAPPPALS